VYYVLDPDYNRYMDAQQRLNLGLLRAFADHGIQLAYPSRTLYVAQPGVAEDLQPALAQ
jgi:small-conductance mechanosensitive channel